MAQMSFSSHEINAKFKVAALVLLPGLHSVSRRLSWVHKNKLIEAGFFYRLHDFEL